MTNTMRERIVEVIYKFNSNNLEIDEAYELADRILAIVREGIDEALRRTIEQMKEQALTDVIEKLGGSDDPTKR